MGRGVQEGMGGDRAACKRRGHAHCPSIRGPSDYLGKLQDNSRITRMDDSTCIALSVIPSGEAEHAIDACMDEQHL